MKKFLRHGSLFALFVTSLSMLIVFVVNSYLETDDFFKIDSDVKAIVVGDSHPECALNDSLIDNFQNFSQSAESYFYSYLKTKKLLEHNSNIKTVYVEFNSGQIIKNIDDCTWDDIHISEKYRKYAVAADWNDFFLLLRNNFRGTLKAQSRTVKDNFFLIQKPDRSIADYNWGAYKALTNNGASKLDSLDAIRNILDTNLIEISKTNIDYLIKLIDVCKEYDAEVVLIRSPVHEKYWGRLSEYSFQYVKHRYFKNQTFLDFIDFSLEDKQFADAHHLNSDGALEFSTYFNEYIKKMD